MRLCSRMRSRRKKAWPEFRSIKLANLPASQPTYTAIASCPSSSDLSKLSKPSTWTRNSKDEDWRFEKRTDTNPSRYALRDVNCSSRFGAGLEVSGRRSQKHYHWVEESYSRRRQHFLLRVKNWGVQ
jgi:hypothetical protein